MTFYIAIMIGNMLFGMLRNNNILLYTSLTIAIGFAILQIMSRKGEITYKEDVNQLKVQIHESITYMILLLIPNILISALNEFYEVVIINCIVMGLYAIVNGTKDIKENNVNDIKTEVVDEQEAKEFLQKIKGENR